MKSASTEPTFLDMIKDTCIKESSENNLAPSVVATLGIMISSWGSTKEYFNTRNIYLIPTKDWYGTCYSKDTGIIYNRVEDCKESGAVLYRVYDNIKDSIKDFITILATSRRSENGPLRYSNIFGVYEYKEAINRLQRSGFFQSYLYRGDDLLYTSTMIAIIERYGLYKWDKEAQQMSKRKYKRPANENENKFENVEHMYRVRLAWDKPSTQIFASPIYNDALEEAMKHEGYKIYIDDGELFEDPWIKEESKEEEKIPSKFPEGIIEVLQPSKGKLVVLKDEPVYRAASDEAPFKYFTGNFYFYDRTIINKRARITVHKDYEGPNPSLILGYIDIYNR